MDRVTEEVELTTTGRIRERLRALSRDQSWLAEKVGVTNGTVSRWMNGVHAIRNTNLMEIAKALECDVEYLKCEQVEVHVRRSTPQSRQAARDRMRKALSEAHSEAVTEYDVMRARSAYLEVLGFKFEDVVYGDDTDTYSYQYIDADSDGKKILRTIEHDVYVPEVFNTRITTPDGKTAEISDDEFAEKMRYIDMFARALFDDFITKKAASVSDNAAGAEDK